MKEVCQLLRTSRELSQEWEDKLLTTHLRLWVEAGGIRLGIFDVETDQQLANARLGGDVIAAHRAMQLLELCPKVDQDLVAAAVLTGQKPRVPADRKARAAKIAKFRETFSEAVVNPILASVPDDLLSELRIMKEHGVEINCDAIIDAVEDQHTPWNEMFREYGCVTVAERNELRRQQAAADAAAAHAEKIDMPAEPAPGSPAFASA